MPLHRTERTTLDALAAGCGAFAQVVSERSVPVVADSPEFLTCEGIAKAAARGREWMWEGWLARGSSTLLVGEPKDGKTTLVYGLLGALERAEEFLGTPTRETRAVILSEEAEEDIAEKVAEFRLNHAVILPRKYAMLCSFRESMRAAVEHGKATGATLIVVDSYAYWGNFPEGGENDSGIATEAHRSAIAPACAEGFGVLVIHHAKRGNRNNLDVNAAIRGSTAIPANFEINALLRRLPRARFEDPRRVLVANGRPRKQPDRLTFEYRDGRLAALATANERTAPDEPPRTATGGADDRMREALRCAPLRSGDARTLCALARIAPKPGRAALRRLVESGAITASGSGRKGSPRRYSLPSTEGAA